MCKKKTCKEWIRVLSCKPSLLRINRKKWFKKCVRVFSETWESVLGYTQPGVMSAFCHWTKVTDSAFAPETSAGPALSLLSVAWTTRTSATFAPGRKAGLILASVDSTRPPLWWHWLPNQDARVAEHGHIAATCLQGHAGKVSFRFLSQKAGFRRWEFPSNKKAF